eukprot:7990809-Pyramimonas_sp.AAC.1
MAQVMVEPETEDIYAAEDSTQSEDGTKPEHSDPSREAHQHARLREQRGTEALHHVKRLHLNMRHLNPAALHHLLQHIRAENSILQCASGYDACACEVLRPVGAVLLSKHLEQP